MAKPSCDESAFTHSLLDQVNLPWTILWLMLIRPVCLSPSLWTESPQGWRFYCLAQEHSSSAVLLSTGTWTSSTAHNLTLPGSHDAGPGKQEAPSVLDSWVKWKCVKRVEIQGLSRQCGAGLYWSKRFLGIPPKSELIAMLFTQRHKYQACWAPL